MKGKDFLDMTPKRGVFSRFVLIKINNLFESYFEANEKISHRLGEIFASNISDKGPVSRIYNDLSNLNNKKTTQFLKEWAKDLNRCFNKDHTSYEIPQHTY